MTEWVSGGGQGSLGCHRLPPHRNNKALFVALSLSLSTFLPLSSPSASAEYELSCEKRASDLTPPPLHTDT